MTDLTPAQYKLVQDNVPLARFFARRMWERAPEVLELDELTSVAYMGLISAATRWDPTRPDIRPEDLDNGKAFSGYARRRIIGSIQDWKRAEDYVPSGVRAIHRELVQNGVGDSATLSEAADASGVSRKRASHVMQAISNHPVSIMVSDPSADAPIQAGIEVSSQDDVESDVAVLRALSAMVDTLRSFDRVPRLVVVLRYYQNLSTAEVAELLGLPLDDVRAVHSSAILSLYQTLRSAMTN